jgi:hypothetical protein
MSRLAFLQWKWAYMHLNSSTVHVGRHSSVGVGTGCGLDVPGIESWWGRGFQYPFRPAQEPTLPPI